MKLITAAETIELHFCFMMSRLQLCVCANGKPKDHPSDLKCFTVEHHTMIDIIIIIIIIIIKKLHPIMKQ